MSIEDRFNSLEWHDSYIEKIVLEPAGPGDEWGRAFLAIEWPSNSKDVVGFEKCYEFQSNLSLMVFRPVVLAGECKAESVQISESKDRWFKAGLELPSLRRFRFETNFGEIEIHATEFYLRARDQQ